MKKQLLKSALIAVAGVGLLAGSALAGNLPSPDFGDIAGYVGSALYFNGAAQVTTDTTFAGMYEFTAIAYEAGNTNKAYSIGVGSDIFRTDDLSNWGLRALVDFSTSNIFFTDLTDAFPTDMPLNPWSSATNVPAGFKIYQLTADSELLSYLAHTTKLVAGDYVIGFNDNSRDGNDSDYDDIIIGMHAVPEPATMLLFGTGILGLAGVSRRKRS